MRFESSLAIQSYLIAVLLSMIAVALWRFLYVPLSYKYKARRLQECLNTLQFFTQQLARQKHGNDGDSGNLLSEELRQIFAEIRNATPQLDGLLTVVENMIARGDTSRLALVSGLESVARQVDAARRAYSVSFPMYDSSRSQQCNTTPQVGRIQV
jgi:hypothetical protein